MQWYVLETTDSAGFRSVVGVLLNSERSGCVRGPGNLNYKSHHIILSKIWSNMHNFFDGHLAFEITIFPRSVAHYPVRGPISLYPDSLNQ